MSYVFFWRPFEANGFLGNWYASPLTIDNVQYSCVEQHLMAMKAQLFGDDHILGKIMATNDPYTHKKLGRLVEDFDDDIWDEHKEDILYDGLYAKFSQNTDLKQQLLATGDKILVEASPYDKVYGIGMKGDNPNATDPSKWKGENLLGKVLMRVRQELSQ